jgi:hypothetical protein
MRFFSSVPETPSSGEPIVPDDRRTANAHCFCFGCLCCFALICQNYKGIEVEAEVLCVVLFGSTAAVPVWVGTGADLEMVASPNR